MSSLSQTTTPGRDDASISRQEAQQYAHDLLQSMDAPPGTVNVLVSSREGNLVLVVRYKNPHCLRQIRRPEEFHGVKVVYEPLRPAVPFGSS